MEAVTASSGHAGRGSKLLMGLCSWFRTHAQLCPKRCIAVDVVGQEKQRTTRYLIPLPFLTHAEFQRLLNDSVAEFGHSYTGPLRLACEEEELQDVLHRIGRTLWVTKFIRGHCLQTSTWHCSGHGRRSSDENRPKGELKN